MAKVIHNGDDLVVLAALIEGQEWRYAEDIASTLRRLGHSITPQKMTGTLRRLCAEDSPMFEAKVDEVWRLKLYRVTRFGYCQLESRFVHTRGLRRPSYGLRGSS